MTESDKTRTSYDLDGLDDIVSEESAEALRAAGVTSYLQLRGITCHNLSKAMRDAGIENPLEVIEKIVDELREKSLLHHLTI